MSGRVLNAKPAPYVPKLAMRSKFCFVIAAIAATIHSVLRFVPFRKEKYGHVACVSKRTHHTLKGMVAKRCAPDDVKRKI